MGNWGMARNLRSKPSLLVALQFRFIYERDPLQVGIPKFRFRTLRTVAPLKTKAIWEVAFKVIRIDFGEGDGTWCTQFQDNPIVAGLAFTAGFPTTSHIRGSIWQNEVIHGAEKHVAAINS